MTNSKSGGSWIALAGVVTLWTGSYLILRNFVSPGHSTVGSGHPGWSRVYTVDVEQSLLTEVAVNLVNVVYTPLSILDEKVTGARTDIRINAR